MTDEEGSGMTHNRKLCAGGSFLGVEWFAEYDRIAPIFWSAERFEGGIHVWAGKFVLIMNKTN